MSNVEDVRRALMMRDAGYDPPPCFWEKIGELLKDHDHLRAALTEAEGRAAGLTEAIIRTRRRLETFCNEVNAGHMPSDAREFMRRVQCGFDSLMEDAAQIKNELPPLKKTEMATEQDIEAGAAAMYGKNWNSPDPEKRPGEKMKDVWRRYAKDAIEGVDAFRQSATAAAATEERND